MDATDVLRLHRVRHVWALATSNWTSFDSCWMYSVILGPIRATTAPDEVVVQVPGNS